jgi:putative colanic acid biosynthesis acetyltransferase WcaF
MTASSSEPIVDTRRAARWHYSLPVYLGRIAWSVTWATIWPLCWQRAYVLRAAILKLFGARTGFKAKFARTAWVEMPWNLTLADYVAFGPRVIVYNLGPVTVGAHTVISQGVHICAGTHDYEDPSYPLVKAPIVIGNYVWIAADAFIGPGVTIGDGAVVGARAVVVKDVPPWTVVAGNPAKPIKMRTQKNDRH